MRKKDWKMQNTSMPLVSINCTAYNHAPYIRQCLDGFIMQKTDFPIEILVHDDASTDGTADIVREYEQKYPNIIKPIYQTENQYSKGEGTSINWTYNYSRAQGKYIAICEGDDYWTDPYKLQKQVGFLEANPEYGLCYTKVKAYWQEQKEFEKRLRGDKICRKDDFFYNWSISTLTFCLRKDLLFRYYEEIKPETRGWKRIGDWPMCFWFYCNSRIHLIDEPTGVYRINAGSATNSNSYEEAVKIWKERRKIFTFFMGYGDCYTPELKKHIINIYLCDRAAIAHRFKRYCECRKYSKMVDRDTKHHRIKDILIWKSMLLTVYIIIKKLVYRCVRRSILLTKMYHYYMTIKKWLINVSSGKIMLINHQNHGTDSENKS